VGYGINSTTEQIFKQMIAQGQTFVTASGDGGAYTGPIRAPADDPNVTFSGRNGPDHHGSRRERGCRRAPGAEAEAGEHVLCDPQLSTGH